MALLASVTTRVAERVVVGVMAMLRQLTNKGYNPLFMSGSKRLDRNISMP
jgi:hypothetical protein